MDRDISLQNGASDPSGTKVKLLCLKESKVVFNTAAGYIKDYEVTVLIIILGQDIRTFQKWVDTTDKPFRERGAQ